MRISSRLVEDTISHKLCRSKRNLSPFISSSTHLYLNAILLIRLFAFRILFFLFIFFFYFSFFYSRKRHFIFSRTSRYLRPKHNDTILLVLDRESWWKTRRLRGSQDILTARTNVSKPFFFFFPRGKCFSIDKPYFHSFFSPPSFFTRYISTVLRI